MAGPMGEDKVNMVPLIDTMFFLILFFMIVTKFTPTEKQIASILPTDKGQMASAVSHPVTPPEQVNIILYPAGMDRGFQPSQYRAQLQGMIANGSFDRQVALRVGGSNPIVIDGNLLSSPQANPDKLRGLISAIHAYIGNELRTREIAGKERKDQVSVVISCFSGLSWKYALIAYDAVREYEARTSHAKINTTAADLIDAREVCFAPPRMRNYNANELGNELFEEVNLR